MKHKWNDNPFGSGNLKYYVKAPSISGPNAVDAPSSFTLVDPPPGTIYWTVSGYNNNFTVTSSGNPTTVAYTGSSTVSATLYARSGSVSGPVIASKVILPPISGVDALCCTSNSYNLNLPISGTIYWTVSHPNVFSVTSSGNPITVTHSGSGTVGSVTLSAHSGSVAGPVVASYSITTCPTLVAGPPCIAKGETETYSLVNSPSVPVYWTTGGGYFSVVSSTSNSVSVSASSSAPEGASGAVIAVFASGNAATANIQVCGGEVQFDVSNLPNGIYYLHVYDEVSETPEIRQIMVEH